MPTLLKRYFDAIFSPTPSYYFIYLDVAYFSGKRGYRSAEKITASYERGEGDIA